MEHGLLLAGNRSDPLQAKPCPFGVPTRQAGFRILDPVQVGQRLQLQQGRDQNGKLRCRTPATVQAFLCMHQSPQRLPVAQGDSPEGQMTIGLKQKVPRRQYPSADAIRQILYCVPPTERRHRVETVPFDKHEQTLGQAARRQRLNWGVFRDRRPDLYQPLLTLDGVSPAI